MYVIIMYISTYFSKLTFTKLINILISQVICEAMRCGNVVKFVHRKALQNVKFKG